MSFRRESDPIGYLLHREFPLYRHLKGLAMQPISRLSAPVEPEERERRANMLQKIERREGELRTLQLTKPQEFQQVLHAEMAKEAAELQQRAEREEQQRFFNQPHARADFDHWGKMPFWSIDEAVALWFGKEPSVVKWGNIESMTEISAFAKQFANKRAIANRAALVNEIGTSNYPSTFIAWANRIGPPFPEQLVAKVWERGPIADWHTLYEQECTEHGRTRAILAEAEKQVQELQAKPGEVTKPLEGRERSNLLRIISALGVMAKLPERGAATSVEKQLEELGFDEPKEATIRKALEEARKLKSG